MSTSIDRSCPNCHNYKGISKVSALYHAAQIADGNNVGLQQRQDGVNDFMAGAVIDRPKSKMAIDMAPPPRPETAMNNRAKFAYVAGPIVVFSVLLSFALTYVLGRDTWMTTLPLLFFTLMIAGAYWVNSRRTKAVKMIPAWEDAMDRWEEMYYCSTCDGVFIPIERKLVPLAQQHALAYENTALATSPSVVSQI